MTYRSFAIVGSSVLAAMALTASSGTLRAAGTSATYEVVFVPSWNPETHPNDYPITHGRKGLLTPIIGATHGAEYSLYTVGQPPTPGLERLSEMGAHDPLDAEIETAIDAGRAGTLIEFADGSPGPVHPVVTSSIRVDQANPRVSLVGMIAPSPDWFYGVSNVQLFDGRRWRSSVRVEAFAMDSGGDAGTSYMSEDADENPKQATGLLDNAYIGKSAPVGTFVFRLVPQPADS